jgi:hypothetical protein
MPTKITRLLKTLMDVISDLRISAIFGQKIFGAKDQEPRAIHQKAITFAERREIGQDNKPAGRCQ